MNKLETSNTAHRRQLPADAIVSQGAPAPAEAPAAEARKAGYSDDSKFDAPSTRPLAMNARAEARKAGFSDDSKFDAPSARPAALNARAPALPSAANARAGAPVSTPARGLRAGVPNAAAPNAAVRAAPNAAAPNAAARAAPNAAAAPAARAAPNGAAAPAVRAAPNGAAAPVAAPAVRAAPAPAAAPVAVPPAVRAAPAPAAAPVAAAPAAAPVAAAPAAAPVAAPAAAPVAAPPAAPVEPHGRAPSGAVRLSPNDLGVIPQDQGATNACGTTSLANVMTHHGSPRTHEQIDRSIRAFDMFTAPDRLVDYARANGMRAELKADSSLSDITNMIDRGAPPIVLIEPGEGNDASLHYVTVTGYNRGADGQVSDVILANSAGAERQTMPAAEFQQRWGNLQMHGVNTGMHNVMITAVPRGDRPITGGDGVARPASSIALPSTGLLGELRSGPSRAVAAAISDGAQVAQDVERGARVAVAVAEVGVREVERRVAPVARVAVAVAEVGVREVERQIDTGVAVVQGGAQVIGAGAAVLGGGVRRLWNSIWD